MHQMKPAEPSKRNVELHGCNILHPGAVREVSRHMPPEGTLDGLAEFFKLFSDKTRVSILCALNHSELCVCDLSMLLKMKQPAISQHLKVLRQMRMVRTRRDGKVIYYTLDDDHIRIVLKYGLEHIEEMV
jgi:ArsR family transcriptional regulator